MQMHGEGHAGPPPVPCPLRSANSIVCVCVYSPARVML